MAGQVSRIIGFSQARSELTKLLDELAQRHEHVVITRNGLPAAVMISPDDYEALQETVEVLQDADLMEALERSQGDVKAGRVARWRDVKRDLRLA
jgi:antitoxin YefM